MNYEEENKLLYLYGLHLAHEDDDGNEVWQLGSRDNPVKEPEFFTRKEAFDYARGRDS